MKQSIFFYRISAVALDKLLEVEEISDTFEGMLKYVQNPLNRDFHIGFWSSHEVSTIDAKKP